MNSVAVFNYLPSIPGSLSPYLIRPCFVILYPFIEPYVLPIFFLKGQYPICICVSSTPLQLLKFPILAFDHYQIILISIMKHLLLNPEPWGKDPLFFYIHDLKRLSKYRSWIRKKSSCTFPATIFARNISIRAMLSKICPSSSTSYYRN